LSQGNTEDEDRLRQINPKWVEKYHIVDKIAGGNTNGFLDIFGGITLADKVF
jgi:sarcosine oxidase/L-pipecolate oxidase